MSKPTDRPKPKRVVSKAEYARIQACNGILSIIAIWLLTIGGIALIVCFMTVVVACVSGLSDRTTLIAAFVWFCVTTLSLRCGTFLQRQVENAEEVQPATRKSVENLHPAEALVRASNAPQTPETVLLRAAQETETPQEQLLRAAE